MSQQSPPPTSCASVDVARSELLPDAKRPRFYYGWVMLPIATVAFIATSPAQTFSIAAFNASFREALGLSHSQLTGAYMVGTLLAALPLSHIGGLADRLGILLTMTVVITLLGLVCIATSQAAGLVTVFLAFLALRMLGPGALGILSGNTLPFWFDRRLGTVDSVRHIGFALTMAVVPAANLWLIATVGWRGAWIALGLTLWGVMLPLMLLFRNHPGEVRQAIDNGHVHRASSDAPAPTEAGNGPSAMNLAQARRTRSYWIACAITAVWSMTITAVVFNIIPLFEEKGLTELDAARYFSVYAMCLAVMLVVGGILADRLPLQRLLTAAVAAMIGWLVLIWQMQSPLLVVPAALMAGVTQGLLTGTCNPLWPRYFGRTHIGRIRGSIATVLVGASSVGPFILGACVDWTGSYQLALIAFVILPLPLLLMAPLATPPVRPA